MLRGVIFDFDGVIVNSEPMHYKVEYALFSELGLDISYQEYCEYAGVSEAETYTLIAEKYSVPIDAELMLREKITRFIKEMPEKEQLPVVDGATELITHLSGQQVPLCVATSGTYEIADAVLSKLDVRHHFKFVMAGNQVGKGKPDPEIFIQACHKLALPPAECLVIEDSFSGLKAASAAEIPALALQFDAELPPGKIIRIHTLKQLELKDLRIYHQILTSS